MPKASDRIKYPKFPLVETSRNVGLSGKAVIVSIINILGDVADVVESIGPNKSGIFKQRNKELDAQKKMLCDAIVDGANSLTSVFDDALDRRPAFMSESPPRGLPQYRNMIVKELLRPLENAVAKKPSNESIDLKPYESSLEIIISGIRGEVHS